MSQDDSHLEQKYDVLLRLAKRESWRQADLQTTLQEITEAAAHTMGIERVNIWLFDPQRTKISCVEHFVRSTSTHSSGTEIAAVDYPHYFKALRDERTIVANDAQNDPRTREFATGYLDVNGITSMLDAPLHAAGDVIGIICHEHVGPKRVWTREEQQFAASLADLASLAMESDERKQAEDALRLSEERTREIITHALDAIVITNEQGIITDWNPRAETLFGWSHQEALGKTLYETVIPSELHHAHRGGMKRFLATGEGVIINKRIEISARNKEGREFPVELAISALRSGGVLSFSAFIRDITDRVRAELEVQKLNAELEEKVQERTSQLKTAVFQKDRLLDELESSSVELLDRLCELEQKAEIISTDLERAQIIQRALLPAHPPRLEGVHVDALYRPGMRVGGDMYDVTLLEDDCIALYVADAAGHGVAAAMLSVLFKQRLQMCAEDGSVLSPRDVLNRVNARIAEDVLAQGLFLTAVYVLFNMRTGEMRAASAGHTPMLLVRANGENILLERTGPALGLGNHAEFTEHHLSLQKGDRLILYTDGLMDRLDTSGKGDVLDLLVPALTGDAREGPARLRGLFHDVDRRARASGNGTGRDDVTLLMLQADHGPSSFDNEPEEEKESPAQEPVVQTDTPWVLWLAENDEVTHLAVRGRGTWIHCEKFRQISQASLGRGRTLHIDLRDCTHLDSAFLGTLHEIAAGATTGRVSVLSPCETVRHLFAELGLQRVLDITQEKSMEPPHTPAAVRQDPPARQSQQRLLRAHEVLSQLSEENRERFAGVVQALRAELGENAD